MEVLLTDDEIVAIAAATDAPWPFGLNTVSAQDQHIAATAFRGGRSLAVRGLADADHGRLRPHHDLTEIVTALASSPTHVVAQVCERTSPEVPRGAMVLAGQTSEGWVVDSVTSAGVHALRHSTSEHVSDLILRFVTEVWQTGVSGPDPGRYGLLVAGPRIGRRMFFVERGATDVFVWADGGIELPAGRRSEPWKSDDVTELLH